MIYIGSGENTPIKLITEINIGDYETGGGGTTGNPEWPDKSQLILGNTVAFAARNWIVSHVTETEAYLTLNDLSGESTWDSLQSTCTNFENQLTEEQKVRLKTITAGNTSGKVFVADYDQMNGGFSYFHNDDRRSVGSIYWTSTEFNEDNARCVKSDGSIPLLPVIDIGSLKSLSHGFRPSVCIDLTLYA